MLGENHRHQVIKHQLHRAACSKDGKKKGKKFCQSPLTCWSMSDMDTHVSLEPLEKNSGFIWSCCELWWESCVHDQWCGHISGAAKTCAGPVWTRAPHCCWAVRSLSYLCKVLQCPWCTHCLLGLPS